MPGSPPDHGAHDPLLIARATAGDTLTAAESTALAERLDDCAACRELHADLLAIAAGLRADLPVPLRPRDFRLSPSEAAAIRRPSWRERVAMVLAGPNLRPIATAACALGLVLAIGGAVLPHAGSVASLASVGGAAIPPGAPSDLRGAPEPGAVQGAPAVGGATAEPAASPAATADQGNVAEQAPSPPGAGQGAFGSAPSPGASAAPVGVVTLPAGGAGDVTTGVIPPTKAPEPVATSAIDLWPVVTVVGVLLFLIGLSGLVVARRRASARL